MKQIYQLLIFFIICQLAGGIGAIFTTRAIPMWYVHLKKPSFSPPNWVFGPAWFLLYTLMSVSIFLVWQKGLADKSVKAAVVLFFIHLIFNALWSILFFGLRKPFWGLVDIIVMWLLIVTMMIKFWSIDLMSSLLLVPYLGWVSFATVLNFFIVKLNP